METKDPIIQQIKETRESRGLSSTQLAEILKVPVDRLYKWEHGKATPKYKDRQKILHWINGTTENVSGDQQTANKNAETLSDSRIGDILACNKSLADASLEQAKRDVIREEKERDMVRTNLELLRMLKTTTHSPEENPLANPDVQMKLLEALAVIGSGTRWETKDKAMIALGNMISVPGFEEKKKASTQAGEGKKSIA